MTHILIDAPVSPYSDPDDIRAWLAELATMEQTPEVKDAIREAEEMLADRERHDPAG
jgi:Mg-chelatase subunit ChlD